MGGKGVNCCGWDTEPVIRVSQCRDDPPLYRCKKGFFRETDPPGRDLGAITATNNLHTTGFARFRPRTHGLSTEIKQLLPLLLPCLDERFDLGFCVLESYLLIDITASHPPVLARRKGDRQGDFYDLLVLKQPLSLPIIEQAVPLTLIKDARSMGCQDSSGC